MGSYITLHQLGTLIQSLSPGERFVFRKLQTLSSDQSLHLRLFELLVQYPEISATEAMSRLGINSKPQLVNLRHHLLVNLMDALVYRNRHTDILISLQQQFLVIEQMLHKNELMLAERLNQKALQLSLHHHQYQLALQLIEQQQRILHLNRSGHYRVELFALETQWQEAAQHQQVLGHIKRLFSQFLAISRESPIRFSDEDMATVRAYGQELELLQENSRGNKFIRMFWLGASVKAEYMQRQFAVALKHGKSFLEILFQEKHFAQLSPYVVLETINTIFYNMFALSALSEISILLEQLQAFAKEHLKKEWLDRWKAIALHTHLKLAHKQADYEGVAKLLHQYQALITGIPLLFSVSEQLSFICSLAISYFVLEDYDAADNLLYDIKKMNQAAGREDILYFSSLFHLLILFEKKDWYQLDIQTQATYHALYARKKLRPFDKEIVLFMKKLTVLRQPAQLAEAATAFLKKLHVQTDFSERQLYFPYFNYPGWLASKRAGLTYRQFCEQNKPDSVSPHQVESLENTEMPSNPMHISSSMS